MGRQTNWRKLTLARQESSCQFAKLSTVAVLWIWIYLDQHSFGCLGSGSVSVLGMRIRIHEYGFDQNLQVNLVFCPSKRLLYIHMYVF
jgi:hypothetical protein